MIEREKAFLEEQKIYTTKTVHIVDKTLLLPNLSARNIISLRSIICPL